jgi:hypothetical protein
LFVDFKHHPVTFLKEFWWEVIDAIAHAMAGALGSQCIDACQPHCLMTRVDVLDV